MFHKRFRIVINLIVITLLLTTTIGMSSIAGIGNGTVSDLDSDLIDSTPVSGTLSDVDIDLHDFDENLTENEPTGDADPYGYPYAIWFDWPVNPPDYFEDAEKSMWDGDDDLMCWAGSASNVIKFTRWHSGTGYGTADSIFDYFQDHWTDEGGLAGYGWNWWFDGTNPKQGVAGWSQVNVAGGAFWTQYNFNNYYRKYPYWASDSLSHVMARINTWLHDGYGLGIGIYGPGGHALTCWGFTYYAGDPDYYTGIFVSDSDDTKNDVLGSLIHRDRLRYYRVKKSATDGKWYLQNYGGSNAWYIGAIMGLGVGPGIAPRVDAGSDITTYPGHTVTFGGSFVNPGPSHTYKWDFGDGTTRTGTLNPTHVYSANGVYTVKLEVTDEQGDVGSDTLKVTVKNVAPIVNAGPDRTCLEGQSITFSGTFSDPGSVSHTIKWSFGDGSYAYNTLTPNKVYKDNGVYTVTLEVKDDDGASGYDTLYVTVNNVAPSVNAGPDQTTDEGDVVTFLGSHDDPGASDTHTYSWNFGDGSPNVGGTSVTHVYADNGVYTVTLTVTDDDGGVGSDSLTVTVLNVAPIVPMYSPSSSTGTNTFEDLNHHQYVGTHYAGLTYSAGAQCLKKPSYNYGNFPPHSGDCVIYDHTSGSIRIDFDYTVSKVGAWFVTGIVTVNLTAYDAQNNLLDNTSVYSGLANIKYAEVQASGIKYVIFYNGGNRWVMDDLTYSVNPNEGDVVDFVASIVDPGADTHTISWSFGDGNTATGTLTPSHAFGDNGFYTVTITVTDDDGGVGTTSVTITVDNIAPTVNAGADQTSDEGTTISLDPASFTDPGFLDTYTATIDWGDSTVEAGTVLESGGSGTVSGSHAYADNSVYTVTLTVTDDDGGVDTDTLTVTVNNVAPIADIESVEQMLLFDLEDLTVIMLDPVYFEGTAHDPGSDDLTFTWDFGDGTAVVTTSYLNDPPSFPVDILDSLEHVYSNLGEYTVTLTVEDDDGGIGVDTLILTVWGPQDLKADAILDLDLSKVGSKHIDRSIDHIIKFIKRSLREKYWKDATHLDPKHGTSVFCYEFVATLRIEKYDHYIRHLEKAIARWEAKGYDTTWLKLKLATVLNAQSVFESVVYQLVKADELIVRVALSEAENTPVKLPKFQGKFDKELAKANKYFMKAMEKVEDEDYSKAIRYFCKSWDHAQNAIKFANKEYKCFCLHHHKHHHKHKNWHC